MTYRLHIEDSNYDKILHMKEYADEIGLTNNALVMLIEKEEEIKDETRYHMRPAIDGDHTLG